MDTLPDTVTYLDVTTSGTDAIEQRLIEELPASSEKLHVMDLGGQI